MKLVSIFLPLADSAGRRFGRSHYAKTRRELVERFGGLTAYSRVPARGFWKDKGKTTPDEIVVFEVMTDRLARRWWRAYRRSLELRFRQDEIVIRAFTCDLI